MILIEQLNHSKRFSCVLAFSGLINLNVGVSADGHGSGLDCEHIGLYVCGCENASADGASDDVDA